ncbi:tyrosine-protein phosphatase [Pseudarthrobacter sp. NIBRBAC000502771]|nr:tyrosine-protein phosphatase [Pseudarthrobacter sp. NIBRBAC000502771]
MGAFYPSCRGLLGASCRRVWLAVLVGEQGRPVGWDGAVNAWRISGGIYRMGRREWLTEKGWKQAFDDGVRTVVDLRNPSEGRRRDSDPVVPASAWAAFDVVQAPTEESGDPRFASVTGPYLNDPAHYPENARLFPEKLVGVFRALALAAPRGDVVLHCAAGRDRSGLVAAMIQDLAGDSDEEIADGYRRAARGINERYRTHGPPHSRERYLTEGELGPLLEQRGLAVVEFVRNLDTRGYLLAHGLPEAELDSVSDLAFRKITL